MLNLPDSSCCSPRSRRANLFRETEQHIVQLLPDDLSEPGFDSIDRATSLGLFPMEGGWMAGGYIAKRTIERMRREAKGESRKPPRSCKLDPQCARELAETLAEIDSSVPAETLLRIRANMVQRGLIE